jgi:D-alanine-D-alanine ligase
LKVASLLDAYAQPVLVEEFIDGPEVTVGVVGDPPRVLGVMEIAPKRKFAWSLYSIEVKRNFEELVEYRCPPALSPAVVRRVEKAALTAFETLGCKDMARIDFRLRPPGQPVFLEINPLPGLNPESSDLCIMAKLLGVSHADLVQEILGGALARYGLRSNQAPQESAVR